MSERIVVLGFLSHFPVAGVAWQTLHYLVGFQRLGFETYYIEAHGCSPTKLMTSEEDDGAALAAAYLDGTLRRFDLGDRWAYILNHPEKRRLGPAAAKFEDILASAALIVNLHGGHLPTPDLTATNRLVYVGTDPVEVEIEVLEKKSETLSFLSAHAAHFTFGENIGRPGCKVPVPAPFTFRPTRQPVVMDFWDTYGTGTATTFTTVGNWRQQWRTVKLNGQTYRWSKHLEFEKFLDLPRRVNQSFELALSSYTDEDRLRLEQHGWRVRSAADLSNDLDAYRRYIGQSRGEFTAAKEQNVRLRSGWFSDRAATYLAAGRPVITQETGFSDVLPVGEGLFAFETMDDIVAAVNAVNADYDRQRRAARAVARECFRHDLVLGRMLDDLGMRRAARRPGAWASALPPDLVLTPVSRWPTRLPDQTMMTARDLPVPAAASVAAIPDPRLSVLMVTHDGLPYTKMCVTSLLRNDWRIGDELIVVDNASTDGTRAFLEELARRNNCVRHVQMDGNLGFAAANNQAFALATGDVFILLNNDTIVPRGWRDGLLRRLRDERVGLAGPVTNRTCNEAQIETTYRTYAEFEQFAREIAGKRKDETTDIPMLAMFCMAMRRDVYERVGPLDEAFEIGMFEDDDYARRVREAGYRIVCAEDVFVHHFGQAALGEFCLTGDYDRVLQKNRARFEKKWGAPWKPHGRRLAPEYQALRELIRELARQHLPDGATALVVSKGDETLVSLPGRTGWHFPRGADGAYANEYPADSAAAIAHLETLRASGAGFLLLPKPAFWWLDYYVGFREHLAKHYRVAFHDPETCTIFDLSNRHA